MLRAYFREHEMSSTSLDDAQVAQMIDYANIHLKSRAWIDPKIPERKLANCARAMGRLNEGERPLILYDETVFRSGKSGILFTDKRILFRELFGKSHSIAYSDIRRITLRKDGGILRRFVNDALEFITTGENPFFYDLLRIANREIEMEGFAGYPVSAKELADETQEKTQQSTLLPGRQSADCKAVNEQWKISLVGSIFGVLVGLLCIRSYPHIGAFLWGAVGLFSLYRLIVLITNRPNK